MVGSHHYQNSSKAPTFPKIDSCETLCFQYDPETKRQITEWQSVTHINQKNIVFSRILNQNNASFVIFMTSNKSIARKEFVHRDYTITNEYYLNILERLWWKSFE